MRSDRMANVLRTKQKDQPWMGAISATTHGNAEWGLRTDSGEPWRVFDVCGWIQRKDVGRCFSPVISDQDWCTLHVHDGSRSANRASPAARGGRDRSVRKRRGIRVGFRVSRKTNHRAHGGVRREERQDEDRDETEKLPEHGLKDHVYQIAIRRV